MILPYEIIDTVSLERRHWNWHWRLIPPLITKYVVRKSSHQLWNSSSMSSFLLRSEIQSTFVDSIMINFCFVVVLLVLVPEMMSPWSFLSFRCFCHFNVLLNVTRTCRSVVVANLSLLLKDDVFVNFYNLLLNLQWEERSNYYESHYVLYMYGVWTGQWNEERISISLSACGAVF